MKSSLLERFNRLFVAPYYNMCCAKFRKENSGVKQNSILFLGDSITDNFPVARFFPTYNTINRGIAGDTSDGLMKRLDLCLDIPMPKYLVLLIGINDFCRGKTVNYVFENIQKIVERIKKKHPTTRIVLQSLYPLNVGYFISYKEIGEMVLSINTKLEEYAKSNKLMYADVFSALIDKEDNGLFRKSYTKDGVHPNEYGYEAVASVLSELFNIS